MDVAGDSLMGEVSFTFRFPSPRQRGSRVRETPLSFAAKGQGEGRSDFNCMVPAKQRRDNGSKNPKSSPRRFILAQVVSCPRRLLTSQYLP